MQKLTDEFINYLNAKKRFISIYENRQSSFTEWFRKKIFKTKSFLSWDKFKDEFLYMCINYARLISHRFADYEIWGWFEVKYSNTDNTNKVINRRDSFNIQNKIYRTIVGKSQVWYSVVRILNVDWVPKFQRIPVEYYSVNISWLNIWSDRDDIKEHNIISVEKTWNWNTNSYDWFTHLDNYIKSWNKRIWTYSKFKFDAKFEFKITDLVKLKWSETMDYLPIFVFNNDIMNDGLVDLKTVKNDPQSVGSYSRYFAESDYVDIADILQDINDRQSQISVEFIKHLTSKMSLPQSFIDSIQSRQAKNIVKMWATNSREVNDLMNQAVENFEYITHGAGESEAKYLTKDGSMIDRAMKQISSHLRNISAITTIPVYMLAVEESGNNRHLWTDNNEMDNFLTKVEQKRQNYYSTLQRLFAYIWFIINWKYELPTIKFSRFKAYDISDKATTAETLMNSQLTSKKSLIKFIRWYDDQEAKEEMDLIGQELINENAITGKNSEDFLNNI